MYYLVKLSILNRYSCSLFISSPSRNLSYCTMIFSHVRSFCTTTVSRKKLKYYQVAFGISSLAIASTSIFSYSYSYSESDSNENNEKDLNSIVKCIKILFPLNKNDLHENLLSFKVRLDNIESRKRIPIIDEFSKYVSKLYVASVPGIIVYSLY